MSSLLKIGFLFLLCGICPAQQAAGVSLTAPISEAEEQPDALIDHMHSYIVALEGVHDTATANAAADSLRALHNKVTATTARLSQLTPPDNSVVLRLQQKLHSARLYFAPRAERAQNSIRQNGFYGSSSLQQAIRLFSPSNP